MFDVTAIGELLIDFTPNGRNASGDLLFARKPGGAPANVLAANSRLGGSTSFIGKVGNDKFGDFLRQSLEDAKINTQGLSRDPDVPTTLAFVQIDARGDRSFSFYRKPGADVMLKTSDFTEEMVTGCRMFHFGSVSLTEEPARSTTLHAVRTAKQAGCMISYDPNYRPPLWNNEKTAVAQMREGLSLADIVKVSEEEMVLLTGETGLEEGSRRIGNFGASLVLVSLGARGAFYRRGEQCGMVPTYDVKTIDTNGAGDAFLGAVHYCLRGKSREEVRRMTRDELEDILSFANAAGSLTTTKGGAIPAMPTLGEVEQCRRSVPLLGV